MKWSLNGGNIRQNADGSRTRGKSGRKQGKDASAAVKKGHKTRVANKAAKAKGGAAGGLDRWG